MFSVTFRSDKVRTKQYKTETGALRAILRWLEAHQSSPVATASLLGPGLVPQVFTNPEEVPISSPIKKDFLQTREWAILRAKAFERFGNVCSCCGKRPEDGVSLHVDHIKPRSLYPELEADIENLQILCELCNVGKSNLSEKKWR